MILTDNTRRAIMANWNKLQKKNKRTNQESEIIRKKAMKKYGIDSFSQSTECTEQKATEFLSKIMSIL